MKLSEQVKLTYQLRTVSDSRLRNELEQLKSSYALANNFVNDPSIGKVINDLQFKLSNAESQLNSINEDKQQILTLIENSIKEKTQWWGERGYQIDGSFATAATSVEVERTDRATVLKDETKVEIESKIKSLTDWRFPTLEIGPGDGLWTQNLVGSDPLYIVDVHRTFLNSTVSGFPMAQQGKIRPYLIGHDANKTDTDLSELPTGQFGFIFAWNVFDFFPRAHIEAFLSQSIQLLRPGGQMLFSYNNCEIEQCAHYAEIGFKSWMPKYQLTELIQKYGFELVEYGSKEVSVHWAQIKKPGTMSTIKAHVAMAKINQIQDYKPVDNPILEHYNPQQVVRLRQLALQLRVDNEHNIMHVHSPGTLHKLIEQARKKI